jgi:hypothetical protein
VEVWDPVFFFWGKEGRRNVGAKRVLAFIVRNGGAYLVFELV